MNEKYIWNNSENTILIIILIIGVVEVGILVFAYLNADEVKCNWLWCTFTDIKEQNYKQFTEVECYVNGLKVNCSEFKKEFPDYASHGWNSINGICPGWKENKSIIECIKEVKGNSKHKKFSEKQKKKLESKE